MPPPNLKSAFTLFHRVGWAKQTAPRDKEHSKTGPGNWGVAPRQSYPGSGQGYSERQAGQRSDPERPGHCECEGRWQVLWLIARFVGCWSWFSVLLGSTDILEWCSLSGETHLLILKYFAQKINEKPQVIADYESGKAIPNNQIMGKIERAIGKEDIEFNGKYLFF